MDLENDIYTVVLLKDGNVVANWRLQQVSDGLARVDATIPAHVPGELIAAVLIAVCVDLLPPFLKVKALSMLEWIMASQPGDNNTDEPF